MRLNILCIEQLEWDSFQCQDILLSLTWDCFQFAWCLRSRRCDSFYWRGLNHDFLRQKRQRRREVRWNFSLRRIGNFLLNWRKCCALNGFLDISGKGIYFIFQIILFLLKCHFILKVLVMSSCVFEIDFFGNKAPLKCAGKISNFCFTTFSKDVIQRQIRIQLSGFKFEKREKFWI